MALAGGAFLPALQDCLARVNACHKEEIMPTARDITVQHDPFDLGRFLDAQKPVYDDVLAELSNGRKRTHWMWFIFPQIDGLGFSATSKRYAIKSKAEAQAYLTHPLLGARLVECTTIILGIDDRSALEIFGSPDDAKLRSSMTLFASVADAGSVFERAIDKYFQGARDARTLELLGALNRAK
jgi:uncharacterized protein (DUF1810 family)